MYLGKYSIKDKLSVLFGLYVYSKSESLLNKL